MLDHLTSYIRPSADDLLTLHVLFKSRGKGRWPDLTELSPLVIHQIFRVLNKESQAVAEDHEYTKQRVPAIAAAEHSHRVVVLQQIQTTHHR